MNEAEILHNVNVMLIIVLMLSGPPILVATVLGLLVGLLQALTQIQDQTLSFAIKLVGVIVVVIFTAPLLGGQLIEFSERLMSDFPALTR